MKLDRLDILAFMIVIIVLSVAFVSFGQTPTPADYSNFDFSKISDADIAATEAHRQALKDHLKQSILNVQSVSTAQSATLKDVKVASDQTQKAFGDYQAAAEAQIAKGNQAITALAKALKQLTRARWIMEGLVVAIAALIFLKVPPPIGAYAAGAFAVAGSLVVWFWI
jgi:hypothetical protein